MKINKILVIRFRRVGDSVLSIAICSNLRKSFPNAQIDYVLDENIASLYENHPDIDNVITFNNEENDNFWEYILKVHKLVKNTKYDVIIDTRSTIKTLFFSLFSLSTSYRIGSKKKYNYLLHNFRIDNHKDKSIDMVQHNLMLLKPLERETNIQYCSDFKLYVSDQEKFKFKTYMQKSGIDFNRSVVIVTVTARLAYKVWNKERMKELLRRMIEKYAVQIIFNFAGSEEEFAVNIHLEMNKDKNIFTNIKADSLRGLCALISNCDFFFGNEGGPRHIAQALELPSYAIYPPNISKCIWLPNEGERYAGISPDDRYSQEEQSGMDYLQRFNLITVDQVWNELDVMLAKFLKK
ncbi:glycosyltransferase family 9 protein [uncultured Bacteroides sp.]|uniref:glycosyltransferase family 9 protein n=1 Tax=uncultured Bacteroides sp. TaxID=162156 RepID=UPI002AA8B55F|nr:glycosyltransferase family 9 protein [uncultured Bacteroides sp.]